MPWRFTGRSASTTMTSAVLPSARRASATGTHRARSPHDTCGPGRCGRTIVAGSIGSAGWPSLTATLSRFSRWTRWASRSRVSRDDVLRQHPAARPDQAATAGPCNSPRPRRCRRPTCPAPTPASAHHLLGLADPVAGVLGREAVADDRRDVAAGAGKARFGSRLRAGSAAESRAMQQRAKPPYSTSSTSTFSPVTRCDRAAAMNRSRSPSSTSDGAVEVTPVRRSFTS